MARPVKLNARLIVDICKNILIGATYQASAVAAGVSYETFRKYRTEAKAALEKPPSKRTEDDELLIGFSAAVDKANAELEISLMKTIKTRGKRDWRALAWILQNRFPDRYSERKVLDANVVEWDKDAWMAERKKRLERLKKVAAEDDW